MSVSGEDQHVSAAVAASDADVVQAAGVAEGELAVAVDGVVADSPAGVVEGDAGRGCLGSGLIGLLGCSASQGAVGPDGVVVVPEVVELALELGDRAGPGLGGQPALLGLVEPFDHSAGLGVVGT